MARWVFLLRAVVVFCLLFAVLVTDPLLFDWDFESRIFTLHPAEFELKTSTRMHWDLVASLKTKNHRQGRDQQRRLRFFPKYISQWGVCPGATWLFI